MSFRSMAPLAAFFLFALASLARAQVPVQNLDPSDATAAGQWIPLRARRCGNVKAQFARGNYYLRARYVILDYAQALT